MRVEYSILFSDCPIGCRHEPAPAEWHNCRAVPLTQIKVQWPSPLHRALDRLAADEAGEVDQSRVSSYPVIEESTNHGSNSASADLPRTRPPLVRLSTVFSARRGVCGLRDSR